MSDTEQPEDLRAELGRELWIFRGWTTEQYAIENLEIQIESILRLCEAAALAALPENPWTNRVIEDEDMPKSKYLRLKAQQVGFNKAIVTAQANIHKSFGGGV